MLMSKENSSWLRLIAQILGIAASSAIFNIAVGEFQSWVNAIWIIGVPLLVAVLANRRTLPKVVMAVLLVLVSVVSVSVTGVQLGFGP